MSTFSEDPLKETLAEAGIIIGVFALIGVGIWLYFRSRQSGGDKSGTKSSAKSHVKSGSKKGEGKKGLLITVIVLIVLAIFTQLYLQNIRKVTNPEVQKEYSGMFDYGQRKWTSSLYTALFYTTYAITFPFMLMGAPGSILPQ